MTQSRHKQIHASLQTERAETHAFVQTLKKPPANPCRCPSAAGVTPVKSNIDAELERYWHPQYNY